MSAHPLRERLPMCFICFDVACMCERLPGVLGEQLIWGGREEVEVGVVGIVGEAVDVEIREGR